MPLNAFPESETDRISYIKQQILYNLGHPVVNIEITEEQLLFQIINTLNQYTQENPFMGYTIERTNKEFDEYSLYLHKEDMKREITQIKEIYRQDDNFQKWNMVYKQFFLSGNLTKLVQTMSYQDIQKKVLKTDPEFTYDERDNKIQFYRPFEKDMYCLVFFFFSPELVDIPKSDFTWVTKYQTQEVKEILGRVRSKQSSIQSSIGNIQLDGQSLLSEQQSEKSSLLEEMKNRNSHFIDPITIW